MSSQLPSGQPSSGEGPATRNSSRGAAQTLGWAVVALVIGTVVGSAISTPESDSPEPVQGDARATLAQQNTLRRGGDLARFLAAASPDALYEIRNAYASMPSQVNDLELILFAEWWADFDPIAALAWIGQQSGGKRYTASEAAFRAWARNSPADAMAAAAKTADPDERKGSTRGVLIGWDESDHEGLEEYVYALRPGAEQQEAMAVLAQRRVTTLGGREAMAWAEGLPQTNQLRQLMVARVFSSIASREPHLAASMVEDQVDENSRSQIPRRIATRWVRQDAEAAMEWLESLPPGPDRDDGVMESFRDWAKLDKEAAYRWLEARIDQPDRWLEPAIFIYARRVLGRDAQRAVELSALITDETQRNTLHTLILRTWLLRDPEAAETWIREANLPPGVVQRGRMNRGTRRPAPALEQ